MRVQSIGTAIEPRHPARDRFLGPAVQMPMGKMHCIAEFDHVAQKVRSMTEALQDTRHHLPPGLRPPLVVNLGYLSGRVRIFYQLDLGFVVSHCSARLRAKYPRVYHGVKRMRIHPQVERRIYRTRR